MIIECFHSSGKKLCFSLPQTWRSSFLINVCYGKILLLCNGRFCFIRVNSLVNLSCWTLLRIKYLLFTKSSKNILVWYILFSVLIISNVLRSCKPKLQLNEFIRTLKSFPKNKARAFFWLISSSSRYFVSELMLLRFIRKLSSLQLKIGNSGPIKNFGPLR